VSAPTRLLLVEHPPDLTEAVVRRHFDLTATPLSIAVTATAELLARSCADSADVLVMGLHTPATGGFLSIAECVWRRDRVPTVFVADRCDAESIVGAAASGGFGWLVPPASPEQWVSSILLAAAHHRQPRRPALLARALEDGGAPGGRVSDGLSPRERRILDELLANRRVAQIAVRLAISPHTVRNHLKSIYRKCDVRSQLELIARFRERR
jgi:DNA-binding NarL/FixJ family response regulator